METRKTSGSWKLKKKKTHTHSFIGKEVQEEILDKHSLLSNDALVLEANCSIRSQTDGAPFNTELPGSKLHLVIFPWSRRWK